MKPLHDVSMIETPEQIELELPLAGVASRAAAYFIDLLWQLVPLAVVGVLVFAVSAGSALGDDLDVERSILLASAVFSLVMFFVNFGYFAFFEVFWKGQTPGKRALRLRVLRDGGYPIDGRSALVRNLMRAVDFLPLFYFVGIAAMFIGAHGKRLGDYAAGTLVVKERDPALDAEPEPEPPAAGGPLSKEERAVVHAFMERRWSLDSDSRFRIASELAQRVAARLGRPVPANPEDLLEELHGER